MRHRFEGLYEYQMIVRNSRVNSTVIFYYASLSGPIPSELGNLTALQQLVLCKNRLAGESVVLTDL